MRFWRVIAFSLVSVALLAVVGAAGAQSDDVTPINPETAEAVTVAQTLSGHEMRVNDVAFSPDGAQLISGSDDLTAIVWNIDRKSVV